MASESSREKILASRSSSDNLIDRSGKKKPEMVFENLRWMTSKEAAFYLRVSVGQLRNLVYQNRVNTFRFGSRLRFLRSDLDRLLKPLF
jgi:excisionase family DNA binding protein